MNISLIFTGRLIKSYFDIGRKSIRDTVPKAIMHCLVNHVKDTLQNELIRQLHIPDQAEILINENDETVLLRKKCTDTLQVSHYLLPFLRFYKVIVMEVVEEKIIS